MPASSDILLCNDIVHELNTRQWALPFVAERTWLPEWTLKGGELDTLQVSVNPWVEPSGEFTERGDAPSDDDESEDEQSGMWSVWPIDLTVCQRLTDQSLEQFDALADLVEAFRRFLCPQRFQVGSSIFASMKFQYLARFDPSQLSRVRGKTGIKYSGVFISAFRVQFRELR
ncbi:hypothetical protein SH661x_001950 [Planctomicrobium sp. SH661]|uniref:hypothetical protein n=1 Tax=Planctomicrobium sp. SH661 TaxID=3448124 RepID=UPI003F5B7B4C